MTWITIRTTLGRSVQHLGLPRFGFGVLVPQPRPKTKGSRRLRRAFYFRSENFWGLRPPSFPFLSLIIIKYYYFKKEIYTLFEISRRKKKKEENGKKRKCLPARPEKSRSIYLRLKKIPIFYKKMEFSGEILAKMKKCADGFQNFKQGLWSNRN